MISLVELKEALNIARKARNKMETEVLSMLIGELTANAKMVNGVKTVTDLEVVNHLQKHLKKLAETIAIKRKQNIEDLPEEMEYQFVVQFLPVMLSESEIIGLIQEHKFDNIGSFMGYMKANHAGLYDGKRATELFKENS